MRRFRYISLLFAVLFVASCDRVFFSERHTIPMGGWHKDSVVFFQWEMTDTVSDCDLLLFLRHTESYRYQNIWLFLDYYYPFSDVAVRDTIEFYLADDMGRWLGNGFGNIKEMPVLLQSDVRYPTAGVYKVEIQQAMRDTLLRGISDIGITVKPHQ